MKIIGKSLDNTLAIEFMRYCVVGGLAFLCDYLILFTLTEFGGFHFLISALLGFIVGMMVNYSLSLGWVFKKSKSQGLETFIIFLVIGIVGLTITEMAMWFGVDVLNFNYMLIKVFVTAIVLLWNYTARKMFVFDTPFLSK